MARIVRLPLDSCMTGTPADAAICDSALIHAGHLDAGNCAEESLVIERGLQRNAPGAQLIIVATGRAPPPCRTGNLGVPRSLSRAGASMLFASYLARQRLLVPGSNETFGDIFLLALASGVPLDTINYYLPRPCDVRDALHAGSVLIRTRVRVDARPRPMCRGPLPPCSIRGL